MSKFKYRDQKFQVDSLALIAQCNEIIESYQDQGLRLTLRQLYYQLVTRNIVKNEEKSYKRVGGVISDGRLAGLIDWSAIEDRVRRPWMPSEWKNLTSLIESALAAYRLPRWEGQDNYVELWVEKDALAGVLQPIASRFHVLLMVNRGYSSQSAMRDAALRFIDAYKAERASTLLYLGDHDPSGEDMVRDVRERLELFCAGHEAEAPDVVKVGLTMSQVQEYNPPPNPAKMSDSRAEGYVAKHGAFSWEVDALDPATLNQIVTGAVRALLDEGKMDEIKKQERKDKAQLKTAVAKIDKRANEDD
jgi:hypothetical protein